MVWAASAVFSDSLSAPLLAMMAWSLERVRLTAFFKIISCCGNFSVSASSASASSARADDNSNPALPCLPVKVGAGFFAPSPMPEICFLFMSCPAFKSSAIATNRPAESALALPPPPFLSAEGCIIAVTRAAVSSGERSPGISSCAPCPISSWPASVCASDPAFSIIKMPANMPPSPVDSPAPLPDFIRAKSPETATADGAVEIIFDIKALHTSLRFWCTPETRNS